MLKMKGKRKKGFTLVELMVVIAIIAVLLLIAVPKLTEATKGAKVRTFEANFRTAMSSVNAAYADSGLDETKVSAHPGVKDMLKSVKDKPKEATYSVEATTGVLSGEITLGTDSYGVKFNPKDSSVTIDGTVSDDLKPLVTLVEAP